MSVPPLKLRRENRPKGPHRPEGPAESKPANPAVWLEQTEGLVDRYRQQLLATAGPNADPGLGYIWIAADHIFESRGLAADFALLDVPELMRDCAWLVTGKLVPFVAALTAFYAFLGDSRLIDPWRAVAIQAELARTLPHRV
jgi:hypothetical protein